ncbi:transcription factor bHLH123-like [Aristolochia californica]|uniref:transcription factor bHLH123-like n=1 Tax=Aristolochia californica TaxID=171875 RepID=UPI0035E27A95
MADEFQTGICSSSSNWWSSSSRNGLAGSSSPCSTALTDIGSFGWGPGGTEMARSCEESASISSVSFQDNQKVQASDTVTAASTVLMDSPMQMAGFGLASPTLDWSHALLRSSGRAESNFQAMLQEDLTSRPNYRQDGQMESSQVQKDWSPKNFPTASEDTMNTFKQINQAFALEQQRPNSSSGDCMATCQGLPSSNFSMGSASYGCPSTMLQGLFDPDPQTSYENRSINFPSQMNYRMNANEIPPSWPKFPQFLKSSPPKQQSSNQLHFSNNTPYWNATAAAINDVRPGFYPSTHTQFLEQNFEEKPNCSNLTTKTNSEEVRDSCSATTKKSGNEPSFKRPRIETPSPLPTFKVRKEKLGDRITALQQLVSPFGKTDTASVLYEAIEYIKFLHEQVTVLTTPYMKNGASMQHQQNSDKSKDAEAPKQDLRSRGLCLVPISSTFPVTNESTADFWTPTFGGTYR